MPLYSIEICDLFNSIRAGRWKKEVDSCRMDLNKKRELPCFTPSGVYKERNSKSLIIYSGIICLDIDNLDHPEELKRVCKSISWVWVVFISPSGRGLKIFIQTDSPLEKFKETEAEIAISFYEITGYMRDDRAKDLARLQYVSFDQELYENLHPEIFEKRSR